MSELIMRQDKLVYILNERSRVTRDVLEENGFPVVVGDGTLSDELLAKCWALLPGRGVITQEVLDKAPGLKLIAKEGVGVERIDVGACTERGIMVTNTPLSNYLPVAEHTMMLILCAAKRFYPLSQRLRRDPPETPRGTDFPSVELYGKTLALIGFGNIGSRVAKLAHAFDMKIVAYVRHPERVNAPDHVTLTDSMEEAIRQGDIVSLHVSGIKENRGLFGAEQFAAMKSTAILINTTRGMIVDETAMYEALRSGAIAGAAVDVLTDEPVKAGNPLLRLENFIVTPHTGANTRESRDRACRECAQAVLDYAEGRTPASPVNQVRREDQLKGS